MKLGLSGPPGSGKDTVADYLVESHSFTHVSTGDLLRREAKRLGLDQERSTLQRLGTKIRMGYGYDILFDTALKSPEARMVFRGIRTVDAAELLLKAGGVLVFLDAPVEDRYLRCQERNREQLVSLAEFIQNDEVEHTGGPNEDMALDRLRSMAGYIIDKIGSRAQLKTKVDIILDTLVGVG